MKLTIGPYSITIRKIQKTKQVLINLSGVGIGKSAEQVIYKVLGDELDLLEGSVPEDLRPQLERTIKIHFRTKV